MKKYENKAVYHVSHERVIPAADDEGLSGWELVSVFPSQTCENLVHLYFKRELPPAQPTPEQIRTVRERTSTSMQHARAALVATDCSIERAVQVIERAGYA